MAAYRIVVKDLEKNSRDMRSKVFDHMLKTRGKKYRSFLRYLRFFKYAACAPDRGEFLEAYYTLMRYLDDVVDGDAALPAQYPDASTYLEGKIRFSHNLKNPVDEVDYLMLYCFEVGKRFGADFIKETDDILESLMFDAQRKGKWLTFNEEVLKHHFHLLDIRGTIRATLKVFNDDPEKYRLLEPLGVACRYQYDIEDIETDLAAGYVNISKEECEKFTIEESLLRSGVTPAIKQWLRYHAESGLQLLLQHHHNLPDGNFSMLEKLVFRVVYENPARKVFNSVLNKVDTDKPNYRLTE